MATREGQIVCDVALSIDSEIESNTNIVTQLTKPDSSFEKSEENLRGLSTRISDLPFDEMLLCRLVSQMGRQMVAGWNRGFDPSVSPKPNLGC